MIVVHASLRDPRPLVGPSLALRTPSESVALLNKLFRQRHLIDNQVAALFNVMDLNPQILA
jgi:hypothetical protein